jgi:ABC-type branched-subunit amino acid transport system permease subunit
MKALCFALFACAFNLLIGFGGLLSFGHAMFLGMAGYCIRLLGEELGFPPELAILSPRPWRRCSASCAARSRSGGRDLLSR